MDSSEPTEYIVEDQIFLGKVINEKFEQKLQVLKANSKFQEEIESIRNKHCVLIDEYVSRESELHDENYSEEYEALIKEVNITPIQKDCRKLANKKEFGLQPIDVWEMCLCFYVIHKIFVPLTFHFSTERIAHNTDDYARVVVLHKRTRRKCLALEMQPDTSLGDIQRMWSTVKLFQKKYKNDTHFVDAKVKLRPIEKSGLILVRIGMLTTRREFENAYHAILKVSSRLKKRSNRRRHFYPMKKLPVAIQLRELDKTVDSDWEKQEIIYGEDQTLKEEPKRRQNIRQLRRRYKKIIN